MALILCSECGKEFSDKAVSCPNCGCPVGNILQANSQQKENLEEENKDFLNLPIIGNEDDAKVLKYNKSKIIIWGRGVRMFFWTSNGQPQTSSVI